MFTKLLVILACVPVVLVMNSDKMIGGLLAQGLADLKTIAETHLHR